MKASKEKSETFKDYLVEMFPKPEPVLKYRNLFEQLIAVVLSAQTTDVAVNKVTEELFEKYPDPASLSVASSSEIEKIIRKIGLFRKKASNVVKIAGLISNCGIIDREFLESLPGVGRKTANIILSTNNISDELGIDTHIKRVATRYGLTRSTNLIVIENDLKEVLEFGFQDWHLRMILFGRQFCISRNPRCHDCKLSHLCDFSQEMEKK
jgi:endonuclease-3